MTTLREIFRAGFDDYARERQLPYRSYKAANAIMQCRTAALGGHVQQCENGHIVGVQYNSCRHRSCPQCNERQKTQWADAQAARLLGCEHYHVIFTLPHELLPLWSHNRARLADLLFSAASGALMRLLRDPRHLGATPGIVASLHTWGRTLSRHPHLHCLVTGGGLSPAGQWKASRGGYLLPAKVLKPVYRGQFLAGLEALLDSGELTLPNGTDEAAVRTLLRRIARKSWNVRIQERYAHGRGVLRYLARYVRGGPLSNHRLRDADTRAVRFGYHDHRDGKLKTLSLCREEFIDRILWHVPETGRHTTRHYGLYGHKARARRVACREQLGQAPEPERPEPMDWQRYMQQIGRGERTRCEQCGAPVRMGARTPRKTDDRISIGRRLRSVFVQLDDEAAIARTRIDLGPPGGGEIFCAENGRLSKR